MKARDWAEKINAAFTTGGNDVFDIFRNFGRVEVSQLIAERAKNSFGKFNEAVEKGVVREAKDKWMAVRRLCPYVTTVEFGELLGYSNLQDLVKK